MTPQELEKLHNDSFTKLRQEFNRFEADMKQKFADYDAQTPDRIRLELEQYLIPIQQTIAQILAKLKQHFGT